MNESSLKDCFYCRHRTVRETIGPDIDPLSNDRFVLYCNKKQEGIMDHKDICDDFDLSDLKFDYI